MRNLIKYPITAEEAISALQVAFENRCKNTNVDGVGDTDGISLVMAEKFIDANRDRFNTFTKASLEVIFEGK